MVMLLSVGNVWAETVTYTVTSKTEVNTSGTAPDGSSASLVVNNGTNPKEQLASGNTMTLTLSGYVGHKITAISLSMKSNSSKGAGSFTAVAGTTTIFSIADSKFNTANWNGAWSTSYVNITPATNDDDYEILENEDVVMTITASANSIYCQSFTITYEDASSTCETLAAPTNPSSTPAQTSVVLSWDAVEHASGYKVVFNGTDYDIASDVTTKTIEDLAKETEYHWTVAAKGDGTTYCPAGTATAQQSVTTLDACTANKAVYTVASTSSVTSSGALEGSAATFANTYTSNKEQMTGGNSQTLTLSGYDGATIKGLTLSMHANASKGAGTFSLVIGSTTVAEISTATNFNAWFDNDSYGVEYRNVHVPFAEDAVVGTGEDIVVTIAATTNSLFCQSFSFCYEEPVPAAVEKPTFTVAEGSYLGAQSVGITCETEGAAIYYTLDGTEPSSTSTPYTGAIDITETKTLKAIAIKGSDESAIASATYTIINTEHAGTAKDPYSVADAKAVIDGIGTKENAYVSGIISQVDSYNSTYKSITYWISADGATSGQQLQVYSGKGIDGADFSSVDDVVAKATVVVKGTLKKHYGTYEFDYNNELVSYEAPAEPIVTLSPSSLNLEAEGNGTQEITLTATNFENEVNEITCAFYNTAACDGEAISQPAWITNLTDNNSNQVSFDVAANTGDARQVWMKVTATGGTDEASAVLAILQAKYTVDYAELPFAFDGGRADIASTNGMSQEGLGTDYNSSPKLKFDGTGDLLIIKINEEPGLLTYSIKNNSFSGGTFTVQESKDGTSYTEVASYTEITNTQNEEYNLDKDTRFVKFIYTEKVNGNVGLGNIEIAEYVAPAIKPTITTQPEGAVYTQGDDAAALTIVAEAGNEGALSYQWYSNDENNTDGAEAIEGATEDEYTPSTAELGTVYYYCVVTEAGADEPTTSNIVAVVVSESTPATVTFELFSGELVEGDYVIYYGDGAMNTTVESDRLQYAEVTPTEDKITNPDASIIWHIAQSGEYWTIYNSAAQAYAASTGAKNKAQMLADGTDDKALWTVSGEATYEFVNKQNTTNGVNANLRKNGTYGFACYSSTQSGTGPLTLYKKKIEGQPATPTFSISGGKYTSAQSVELSCATEGAAIYYTTDGITTPTLESTPYNGAISVSETMTIKAIAIKNEIASDVASATYTIVAIEHEGTENDPYTIADARNAIDVYGELTGKYVAGIISQVDSYNSTYKSITYWISADGETTSPQLQVYSGKGLNGADFASKDDLQAGDIVIVKGALKLHNNSVYEFDYNNQLVSLVKPAVPTVTLKQSDVIVTALNVEAAEVANQEIDIVCANFESQITSVNAKLYVESTCETEITSDAWVTDITVNGTSQVTFNVADNAGDARQVWMKVTATGGTDEASAVLTISQAKPDYATLPFTFDGVKADIANKAGMSHSGLGSDYAASPKLKFDNTDDYLIIHINEAPGKLTYDIKNNSFADGIFTVQESADGETYTEVASHTEIVGTQNEEVDLKEATRYVKFIYTEKVTGNVGLGNIAISEYVEPEPPVVNYTEVRNGLTEGWYYTMCLDKAVTAVKAGSIWRVLSKAANGDVILEEAELPLVAGRPYIFRAAASTLEVAYTGDAVGAPVNDEDNNGLVGSFTEEPLAQNSNHYIIYNNALYYVNSDNVKVGAHRAYLDMTGVPAYSNEPQQGNAPRRRVVMTVHGEQVATGIDAINAAEAPVKVMINGQIYILRGEKMYDATGRMVK